MKEILFSPFSWLVAGVMLGVVELLLPGFVFVGMAGAAVVIGIALFPFGDQLQMLEYGFYIILIIFSFLTLFVWALLRRLLGRRDRQEVVYDYDINEIK